MIFNNKMVDAMPGGRPTDYNAAKLKKTRHYVENHNEYGDLVPSIAGLAVVLKCRRETISEWAKHPDRPEFSVIVATLMAKQEALLLSGGLGSTYNASIAKLMLTKHGYSDKVENNNTHTGNAVIEVKHV